MSANFPNPPELPSCSGPDGILYDFNYGARVLLPEGKWHVILMDDDSGNILFSCDSEGGWVTSNKKYYVRFRIQVFHQGSASPVLDETLDMKDKPVVIFFPTGTLGDMLGWFHYAERFRQLHRCQLECVMGQEIIELLSAQYPEITFSTKDNLQTVNPYASCGM